MTACTQKALVLLVGFALAFSLQADAAQVRATAQSRATEDQDIVIHKHVTDDTDASSDNADDDDEDDVEDDDSDADTSASSSVNGGPVYEVKAPAQTAAPDLLNKRRPATPDHAQKKQEDDDENEGEEEGKEDPNLKSIEKELSANLHEQSELRQRIEHLTNKSESDQEIDEYSQMVANQTDSEALGDTLSQMWKEMRTFEVPDYTKHVQQELRDLKHDERDLEKKLTGEVSASQSGKLHEHGKDAEESAKLKATEKSTDVTVSAENDVPAYTWNVWKMSHQQQKSVFWGSLFYLVSGVIVAALYDRVRAKYGAKSDAFPSDKDFSHHIFGCFDVPRLCFLGFCCPCLTWANTLDRRGLLSYWKAFMAFFLLLILHAYTNGISSLFVVILGVIGRQKLRDSYGIESRTRGTVAMDCFLWCCCQPCAIVQEAREEAVARRNDQVAGP